MAEVQLSLSPVWGACPDGQAVLEKHNEFRARHGCAQLSQEQEQPWAALHQAALSGEGRAGCTRSAPRTSAPRPTPSQPHPATLAMLACSAVPLEWSEAIADQATGEPAGMA